MFIFNRLSRRCAFLPRLTVFVDNSLITALYGQVHSWPIWGFSLCTQEETHPRCLPRPGMGGAVHTWALPVACPSRYSSILTEAVHGHCGYTINRDKGCYWSDGTWSEHGLLLKGGLCSLTPWSGCFLKTENLSTRVWTSFMPLMNKSVIYSDIKLAAWNS